MPIQRKGMHRKYLHMICTANVRLVPAVLLKVSDFLAGICLDSKVLGLFMGNNSRAVTNRAFTVVVWGNNEKNISLIWCDAAIRGLRKGGTFIRATFFVI